jgi:cell division protease FtsH
MMEKKINYSYIILILIFFFIFKGIFEISNSGLTIPYSDFRNLMKEGKINEVTINNKEIKGKVVNAIDKSEKVMQATIVNENLAIELDKLKIKYTETIDSNFFTQLLSWILPVLVFFVIWMFLLKKFMVQGNVGMMSISKNKSKIYVERDIKITFDDVAGVDEAKDELKEIIDFLKDPVGHARLGAKMPKGVLLIGPPGTGKTLLAKAVAGEAGVPFFSISGSEFVEMFVGVGAARVRDLFDQARIQAPCIIFIDELDALGKARGVGMLSGGHDEKEQTLNQLLSELDGFDSTNGVILLAATNRPEVLDPALLRAGRFDRQVLVDRPEKSGRLEILKVHVKKIILSLDLKLEQVAALTPGFTGADLANLVNEAALSATRQNRESVILEDFNIAIERIVAGLEKKSRVLNEKERKIVACHEVGHAFVACMIPGSDKVHKVSIIPRSIGSLGYTINRPTEDRYLMTKTELENKMAILLGGRASEKFFFNDITTGSVDDITKATDIARSIIMRYGMAEELDHVSFEIPPEKYLGNGNYFGRQRDYSEKIAEAIDDNIKIIINKAFLKATLIIENNKDNIDKATKELLLKETLNEDDLKKYITIKN